MAALRELINKEPAMMLAAIIGVGGLALPLVIVPIRRAMGLPTYQWDADPEEHPFLHRIESSYRRYKFDDAKLLAKWAQHDEYHFSDKLSPKSYDERDFPEARERLTTRSW